MTTILPHERQLEAMLSIYRQAETNLTLMVERAVNSGALGTARYRRQQLDQVSKLLGDLQKAALPQVGKVITSAYQDGLTIANLPGVKTAFTGVHTEAIEALASSLTSRLTDGLHTIGRRTEDVFRKEGMRITALHLAEGNTRVAASEALVDALKKQGVTTFTDRAGRDWGLSRYTEMVVRTTTREAVSTATRNRLLEGGMDLATWQGNGENCAECAALNGKTFSLTGETDGYEVMDSLPPLHPYCTCVLTGSTTTFEQLKRELDEDPSLNEAMTGDPQSRSGDRLDGDGTEDQESVDAVESAADAAQSLYGNATPPKVRFETPEDGVAGSYSPDEGLVKIHPDLPPDVAATIYNHEVGHHLDLRLIGEHHPARKVLLEVLDNSTPMRDLRAYRRELLHDTKINAFIKAQVLKDADYLLEGREQIARAVEQLLAGRSTAAMEGFFARTLRAQGPFRYAVWDPDEFEMVAKALEKWFTRGGLK